jgi:hypothetical protein
MNGAEEEEVLMMDTRLKIEDLSPLREIALRTAPASWHVRRATGGLLSVLRVLNFIGYRRAQKLALYCTCLSSTEQQLLAKIQRERARERASDRASPADLPLIES